MDTNTLEPILSTHGLSANSPESLPAIYAAQRLVQSVPQSECVTEHILHAGMYARTIRIGADQVGVGTMIKVPTLLIIHGDVDLLVDGEWAEVRGYAVLAGAAGRKQVFITRSAVEMTMVFPTQVLTVEEAEREFTDECEDLLSRRA